MPFFYFPYHPQYKKQVGLSLTPCFIFFTGLQTSVPEYLLLPGLRIRFFKKLSINCVTVHIKNSLSHIMFIFSVTLQQMGLIYMYVCIYIDGYWCNLTYWCNQCVPCQIT